LTGCDELDLNQEIPDYPGEILMGCDRTYPVFCITLIQTTVESARFSQMFRKKRSHLSGFCIKMIQITVLRWENFPAKCLAFV
jgi:hypothetical protein